MATVRISKSGTKQVAAPAITSAHFASVVEHGTMRVNMPGQPAQELALEAYQFSNGKLGWRASGKVRLQCGASLVNCNLDCNVTIDGTKGQPMLAPQDDSAVVE